MQMIMLIMMLEMLVLVVAGIWLTKILTELKYSMQMDVQTVHSRIDAIVRETVERCESSHESAHAVDPVLNDILEKLDEFQKRYKMNFNQLHSNLDNLYARIEEVEMQTNRTNSEKSGA